MAKSRTKEDHVIPMKESELHEGRARIKVVGCGGGGGNAVNRMISKALKVQFIAVNTDKQALERCQADVKVQMGSKLTRGLGAGGDWTRGRDAADESRAELSEVVKDSDMVFITAGMGGGTGTGSAAIVAQAAKEAGALTIGAVTRPVSFEGRVRNDAAADPSANIIFGVVRDDTMQGEIKITVIATGFGGKTQVEARQVQEARKQPAATFERPEFGSEEMGDINIPAFLRNRM